jgi:hypothetical protein
MSMYSEPWTKSGSLAVMRLHHFVLALGLDHGGAAFGHGDGVFLGRFVGQRGGADQAQGGSGSEQLHSPYPFEVTGLV